MTSAKVTFAAPAAGVGAGLILALFEVQGWEMPNWLAVPLVVMLVAGTIVFAVMAVAEIPALIHWLAQRIGVRTPVYRRLPEPPHPHQWLLDIADAQIRNPAAAWTRTGQWLESWNLDAVRPLVRLRFTYFHGGLKPLRVTGAKGYPTVFGERVAELVFDENQTWQSVPHNHPYTLSLTVYLPPAMVSRMHQEIARGPLNGVIGLSGVTFGLGVLDSEHEVQVALTDDDKFPHPHLRGSHAQP